MLSNQSLNLLAWKGRRRLYTNDDIPYSSVSGVCDACPPDSSSLIHPADSLAFSKSKRCVFKTSFKSTSEFVVLMILAVGYNALNTFSNFASSSSLIKSILLIINTSQNSTWSINKSAIERSSVSSTL